MVYSADHCVVGIDLAQISHRMSFLLSLKLWKHSDVTAERAFWFTETNDVDLSTEYEGCVQYNDHLGDVWTITCHFKIVLYFFSLSLWILEASVRLVWELKLGLNFIMQQDRDPKHDSKSTSKWLKNKESTCCIGERKNICLNLLHQEVDLIHGVYFDFPTVSLILVQFLLNDIHKSIKL